MGTVPVVMPFVCPQDSAEMAFTVDQRPVGAFPSNGTDPALGYRIGLRGANWCFDDADAERGEHLVKGRREPGIAVANEESHALGPILYDSAG
jgi:hypothetical protein